MAVDVTVQTSYAAFFPRNAQVTAQTAYAGLFPLPLTVTAQTAYAGLFTATFIGRRRQGGVVN